MADPKYANLPGIAHDQPDVYETNDLPEVDQYYTDNIDEDSVETLHISAKEASERFKGSNLSAQKVDFSDRIRVGRKGYVVSTSGTYSIRGSGPCGFSEDKEEETPLEKYQRLQFEIRELGDDLESILSSSTSKNEDSPSMKELALQTETLESQLRSLALDETLGSEKVRDLEDPSGKQRNKLLNELGVKFQSVSKFKKGEPTSNDSVTYEFYLKPETTKMVQHIELATLEKRIDVLEKALGVTSEKMNSLNVETSEKTILNAISVLSSRTYLLEPSHLDHIEGRLYALHQKVKDIAEKKTVIEDVDKKNKISELYDLVTKNQGMSYALPEIVNRLETLESLHHQALGFSKTLSHLDLIQEKLVNTLSNNQQLLTDTKSKIMENFDVIQKNFASIEKRIEKIK